VWDACCSCSLAFTIISSETHNLICLTTCLASSCAPPSESLGICKQEVDEATQMGESLSLLIIVGDFRTALATLKRIEQMGQKQALLFRDCFSTARSRTRSPPVFGFRVWGLGFQAKLTIIYI
jgi:hypothetical protein